MSIEVFAPIVVVAVLSVSFLSTMLLDRARVRRHRAVLQGTSLPAVLEQATSEFTKAA